MTIFELFPKLAKYQQALAYTFERFDIDTVNRQASFLAQTGHESGRFSRFTENLNYSAAGLLGTWPKRFNQASARACHRQPEKIANTVYANRMGNRGPESGDGWKFRGRGVIQITGHDNYAALAKFLERSLDDTVAYLETPEGAFVSAGWFWSINRCNGYADADNIIGMTKIINGGLNGIKERVEHYNEAKAILKKNGLFSK